MGKGGAVAARSVRPHLLALGVLWVLPALLVLVLHVVLPDHSATGGCSGIGFGCSLPPSEAVVLLGLLAAGPLILLGLVVCVVIAVVQSHRARHRSGEVGQASPSDSGRS